MNQQGIGFDPRTKLLLLLLSVLSAMISPSLPYTCGLIAMIVLFGLLCRRTRFALFSAMFYLVLWAFTAFVLSMQQSTLQIMLIAFLGLIHKIYPCSVISGIIIPTTKVSEFLSAMNRIRAPKALVIPLAVMLRYVPTIQEDWRFIKDAMNMRDVSPSLKGFFTNPSRMVECIYVPLMMAASKAADELSVASITRGIENPKPRTCLVQIGFGFLDYLLSFCFLAYFIAGCIL